jgi:pyruvate/2-oxoacid:ferredoxin oxidoreductase alpha subunit
VGAPWSIFNDQQDSFSQRDTGWIQIYCRDNQEIIDTIIQAYRIAEAVYIPVMVCYDGFVLSHTMMPVDIPDHGKVREFLPPYKPFIDISPENPVTVNPVFFPWRRENAEGVLCDGYMEKRFKLQDALLKSADTIREVSTLYGQVFGRDHGGLLWEYMTDDAEVIIVGMGSIASEATVAADSLREEGIKAGVVGIRVFRPFPKKEIAAALKKATIIVVFEKCVSYGCDGGVSSDIKSALYGTGITAPLHNYISGLGGRDVKARELADAVKETITRIDSGKPENETTWLNCYTG